MNNTPAFPTSNWQKITPRASGYNEGMTLRDYFAAKASEEDIEAHINGSKTEHIVQGSDGVKRIVHKNTIYTREQAKYKYADAMLKAREA